MKKVFFDGFFSSCYLIINNEKKERKTVKSEAWRVPDLPDVGLTAAWAEAGVLFAENMTKAGEEYAATERGKRQREITGTKETG
ncbi:hypothetical protein [Candidatus Tokpelaia sp.]|uniref:hypothetical protein n=1 Tax=Candidatus Tokpelaia sp. TaxID=2233777 RepID=UPI00123BDE5A|nr:hypothetical protein [Candidatus Tokpelaia sp.]